MHALVGNIPRKLVELTKQGESVWEVKGLKASYKISDKGDQNAAQAALTRGSKVWIVTDGSQARGSTKQQLQSLKILIEKAEGRFAFVVAIALEKPTKRIS